MYCIVLYYIISYHTISYHITSYHTIQYHILYYIMLCYIISRNKPPSISSATAQLLPYSWPHSHIPVNKTRNVHINVKLKRVRATTVAVRKQYLLHILSVCQ